MRILTLQPSTHGRERASVDGSFDPVKARGSSSDHVMRIDGTLRYEATEWI
jgi:hypothetical protein